MALSDETREYIEELFSQREDEVPDETTAIGMLLRQTVALESIAESLEVLARRRS